MTYIPHPPTIANTRRVSIIDPAWILLTLTFAVLLSATIWSNNVVDQSLEDWHGNVRSHASAQPR